MSKLKFILPVLLFATVSVCTAEKRDQPNVVLIMADDVSWEAFGCYGADDYQTPNLVPRQTIILG